MLASTESVDPDFADERSTQDGSSVNVGVNGLLNALGGETPKIWDDEDLDDEATKKRQGAHHIGSAVVPQKVVEKYDKARKDYEAALKAKKDKKDRLRREAAEAAAAEEEGKRVVVGGCSRQGIPKGDIVLARGRSAQGAPEDGLQEHRGVSEKGGASGEREKTAGDVF
jgi:hypothetical protein